MYLALKHLHVTCVVISITGFFLRGALMAAESPILRQRWIRVVPHVNDATLLAAAIALSAMSGQYPFVDAWLTAKVFGLIAYILLGSIALKAGRTKRMRIAAWLAAMVTFGYVVSVALMRDPAGFLGRI